MPETRIGSHVNDASRLRLRGKDTLSEVIGTMSFSQGFYLAVTGREPTPAQSRVFDAALLLLMDHGLTPSALVARLVADSSPDDEQIPLAAGALMIGNRFAGTMAGAGRLLSEGHAFAGDKRVWADQLVARMRQAKQRLPGFGHNAYKGEDPRATRLFDIAREAGVEGSYIELIHILGEAADAAAGKHIVLNATGALGAVLHEIRFPVEAMRSVAVVARVAGLSAHILEERTAPIANALLNHSETFTYSEEGNV